MSYPPVHVLLGEGFVLRQVAPAAGGHVTYVLRTSVAVCQLNAHGTGVAHGPLVMDLGAVVDVSPRDLLTLSSLFAHASESRKSLARIRFQLRSETLGCQK